MGDQTTSGDTQEQHPVATSQAPVPGADSKENHSPQQLQTSAPQGLRYPDGTSVIDPNTGVPYPAPPGIDVSTNVVEGRSLTDFQPSDNPVVDPRIFFMVPRFRAGGTMDYQRPHGYFAARRGDRKMEYRNVTNYNYGAVSASVGYQLEETLSNAGIYNRVAGNPRPGDTKWGIQTDAVNNITQGWSDYQNKKWERQ